MKHNIIRIGEKTIPTPGPQLYWQGHPELISSFNKMGTNNVPVVKENHVHEEGVLMEFEVLHPSYLCSHDLIVDHLSNVGSKFIPHVCMDILDIQCHDVHHTLCIGSAIHSQY